MSASGSYVALEAERGVTHVEPKKRPACNDRPPRLTSAVLVASIGAFIEITFVS